MEVLGYLKPDFDAPAVGVLQVRGGEAGRA